MNRDNVVALALVVVFLAVGASSASASPQPPLPEAQTPQATLGPVVPGELDPEALPFDEPKPIFVDCIDGCISAYWQCYDSCQGDPWCQNWCEEGRDRCFMSCSP